jgi:hypothetical protein
MFNQPRARQPNWRVSGGICQILPVGGKRGWAPDMCWAAQRPVQLTSVRAAMQHASATASPAG